MRPYISIERISNITLSRTRFSPLFSDLLAYFVALNRYGFRELVLYLMMLLTFDYIACTMLFSVSHQSSVGYTIVFSHNRPLGYSDSISYWRTHQFTH